MKTNKGKVGVYAGTFDIPTNGHLWMIQEGAKIFDTMYVAIGDNPGKKCMFPTKERLEMLRSITKGIDNIIVTSFPFLFLMNYAKTLEAQFVLRGIRNNADCEYERAMRHVNNDINSGVTTVFLMPPRELAEVSSNMVKGLIGPEGWEDIVKGYVPETVFRRLVQR